MLLTSDAVHTGPPPIALARVLGALALRTLPQGRQVAHGGREYPAALAVRRRETWHIERLVAVHRVQRQHHEHGARTCTRYSRLRPKLQFLTDGQADASEGLRWRQRTSLKVLTPATASVGSMFATTASTTAIARADNMGA